MGDRLVLRAALESDSGYHGGSSFNDDYTPHRGAPGKNKASIPIGGPAWESLSIDQWQAVTAAH